MSRTAAALNYFNDIPLRTETRLLILSTCKKCGEAKLVSSYDGSRQQWQNHHQCKDQNGIHPVPIRTPRP